MVMMAGGERVSSIRCDDTIGNLAQVKLGGLGEPLD